MQQIEAGRKSVLNVNVTVAIMAQQHDVITIRTCSAVGHTVTTLQDKEITS